MSQLLLIRPGYSDVLKHIHGVCSFAVRVKKKIKEMLDAELKITDSKGF